MYKLWIWLLLLGGAPVLLRACDVCGSSSVGIGLLTDYKRNFVRLSYFYTSFEAAPHIGYRVSDRFHQANLSVRYGLGNRVRLFADLPVRSNWRYSALDNNPKQQTGLGDGRLLGYYVIHNRALSFQNNLYWEIGGGFSFPTGQYDPDIHDRNLPENFNVGTGAMGYLVQTNAIVTIQQLGIVTSLNYQHNGPTPVGYRFGDLMSAQWTLFHEVPIKKIKLIPNLGIGVEHIFRDHYTNGKAVFDTGATGCFLTAALNLKTDTWLAGISASLPWIDYYGQGNIRATGRLSAQVSYLF